MAMRRLDDPTFVRQILTSPTPTRCWAQTQLSLISIFRTGCYAIWAISVFHQASEQIRFGKPTTVEWQDTLVSKIQWWYYRNISIGWNFDRRSTSISGPTLPVLLPNRPLRNMACTSLYLLLIGHGNPSQWTTCQASHPPSEEMTVFFGCLSLF